MPEISITEEQSTRNEEPRQQQLQRLWLVRHGATAWNLERRFIGHEDIPLAPLGRTQARWVGRRLRLEHIAAIYSSDLQRAHETATIIAQQCSLQRPVLVSSAWREMFFGDWEGLTYAQIADQYKHPLDFFSDPINHPSPGGETFSHLLERVQIAFAQLAQDAANGGIDPTNQGDIVLVSHAGPLRVLLCLLLGIPLEHLRQLRLDHGSLSAIDFLPAAEDVAATVSLALLNVLPLTRPKNQNL
jgi:broad specificity phosphatase PhoE